MKKLYKIAKENNIKIKHFKDKNINGLCICNKYKCNIYMNCNINSYIMEKCVLAEELGHYFKGICPTLLQNTSYEAMSIRSINEFRAKKWAVNEIIPFETFKSYFGTNKSKFEVANELNVTEDFIDFAYFLYEPYLYG